ncbi:hypothetical protein ACEN85_19790, partial [Curtobacterium sp. CT11-45]|uniref:hypothetical protein n=1 Tax=Curtobacterium sp. CT11-45 TaxID=3243037 RepID=UPI0039B01280
PTPPPPISLLPVGSVLCILARRTTVVLVPGLSVLPRHWDVAVEVTRHGCTVRHPHERRGTPVAPALPQLQLDEPG